ASAPPPNQRADYDGAGAHGCERSDPANPVEPLLVRRHENPLAIRLLERGENLVRRIATIYERDDVHVDSRRESARHGGPAREHVERTRTGAADHALDSIL